MVNVILNVLVEMLKQINRDFLPYIDLALNVIDEVSFDPSIYSNLPEMNKLRNDCLKFYAKLCSINIKYIYTRRLKLIEFLNVINQEYARIYYEEEDGYLILLNALDLIKYLNVKLY